MISSRIRLRPPTETTLVNPTAYKYHGKSVWKCRESEHRSHQIFSNAQFSSSDRNIDKMVLFVSNKKKTNGAADSMCVFAAAVCLCLFLSSSAAVPLKFKSNGEFKILQVADMHYADGKSTPCLDVLPGQVKGCSDLNTTVFVERMIRAEKPDFIVFTGDNIMGIDATDAAKSMNAAFSVAISSNIPWVAVLGNHDQESTLSREGVMQHIVGMKNTLSQLNPPGADGIDGFGNYNLEVSGVEGSSFSNKSILNLYFLDSGDYSTVPSISGYGWIKTSQQYWFQQTSKKLREEYMGHPEPQRSAAPGLAYFHIPLPEFAYFDASNFTGVRQEGISSASVNSGFFTTLVEAGDVKAVFVGHDHVNDFCGELNNIHLCYAGGFGYHAYGKAGWDRRARVVVANLEKTQKGDWGVLKSIKTWKRLDDENLTAIDARVLWSKSSTVDPPSIAPAPSTMAEGSVGSAGKRLLVMFEPVMLNVRYYLFYLFLQLGIWL